MAEEGGWLLFGLLVEVVEVVEDCRAIVRNQIAQEDNG